MDAYEVEIYKFLTQRENFENMVRVMDNYDMVRRKLIQDFWELVFTKLGKLNAEHGDMWEIKFYEDLFYKYSKLFIYKETWKIEHGLPALSIAWERLAFSTAYYGVWINNESKVMDTNAIRRYAQGLDMAKDFEKPTDFWGFWSEGNYDFSKPSDLVNILPDKQEETATEYARTIFELAVTLEVELDKMFEMRKA